jgi:hypothetical protein
MLQQTWRCFDFIIGKTTPGPSRGGPDGFVFARHPSQRKGPRLPQALVLSEDAVTSEADSAFLLRYGAHRSIFSGNAEDNRNCSGRRFGSDCHEVS